MKRFDITLQSFPNVFEQDGKNSFHKKARAKHSNIIVQCIVCYTKRSVFIGNQMILSAI